MFCRRSRILSLCGLAAVVLVALTPLGCGEDKKDPESPEIRNPEDFLPQSMEDWTRTATYTATTLDELRGEGTGVNGGYQPFESNNWRAYAEGVYAGEISGSTAEIRVWIFELATATDALRLYTEPPIEGQAPSSGASDTDEPFGDASRIWVDTQFGQLTRIDFTHGKYYVYVYATNRTGPDVNTVLHAFAGSVDEDLDE